MAATTPLLERDEELATINRMLAAAVGGEGALLTIEGEAGAGKTSLLDAAAERGAGMTVLRARGGEYERDFPYGVVRQLFEPLFADPARREELPGDVSAPVAPLFEPAAAPAEGDPFAIQHGLYGLVLALSESSPLLVLVDDAQWADLASLRALAYVGRRCAGQRVALALTVRSGEPGEHEPLLDELRHEPAALIVRPAPLSPAAAGVLVAAQMGEASGDGFATACCEATAGNPFLLVELLRGLDPERIDGSPGDSSHLAEVAAAGASRTILARLERLGEEAIAVARAVAILEPHAEGRRVAALSDLSPAEVAVACERLIVASLLTDTRPVGFVHPLVRAAVLGELAQPRLGADHARAARLLSEDGAAGDAVAAHLLLSEPGDDPWAVSQLRAAAAEARGRGAPEAAVTYLRRTLREPPPRAERAAVSRELGVALLLADDPEGMEVLRAVRAGLEDPVERAEVACELAASLAFRRPGGEGVAMLEESLAEVEGDHPQLATFLRGHLLIQTISGLERLPEAVRPEPEAWPEGGTREGRFVLRQLAFLYAAGFGPIDPVAEIVARICPDVEVYGADAEAGVPAQYQFIAQTLIDQGDRTDPYFDAGLEAGERRGPAARAATRGARACCRFADGDLRGAESDAELALRLTEPSGIRVQLVTWVAILVRIRVLEGDVDAAQRLLDEVWRGRDPGPGMPGALLLLSRGELRLASGRPAEARHDFLAAGEQLRWLPFANPEMLGWRTGLALAEDALGNREEARRLAAEAVRIAREAGGERGIGVTLRVLGSLTSGEEGIALLRESVETLGATRARLQHAEALADLGAALRRANRRKDAREPLREALDLAHRCGAGALEERARMELKACGARPRKAVLSGVESLTPSELRVARMAAEQMTNREIAQSLFVTTKTVETHLRHVYQKLDVAKRSDLAAALD